MPSRDIHSTVSVVNLITPAVLSADSTLVTADLRGFNGAQILLHVGAGGITFDGTNRVDFVLTHSFASGSGFENVTTEDVIGTAAGVTNGIVRTLNAAHAAAAWYRYGYIGRRPFVRLLADFSGTHGVGTLIGACVLRGLPRAAPTANQP